MFASQKLEPKTKWFVGQQKCSNAVSSKWAVASPPLEMCKQIQDVNNVRTDAASSSAFPEDSQSWSRSQHEDNRCLREAVSSAGTDLGSGCWEPITAVFLICTPLNSSCIRYWHCLYRTTVPCRGGIIYNVPPPPTTPIRTAQGFIFYRYRYWLTPSPKGNSPPRRNVRKNCTSKNLFCV